jgi:adenylosuccinate lyase
VKSKQLKTEASHSEFLILPGGKILAHNITPAMARILSELNPADEPMRRRANLKNIPNHELPN